MTPPVNRSGRLFRYKMLFIVHYFELVCPLEDVFFDFRFCSAVAFFFVGGVSNTSISWLCVTIGRNKISNFQFSEFEPMKYAYNMFNHRVKLIHIGIIR